MPYTFNSPENQIQTRRRTAALAAPGPTQIAFVLDQSASMDSVRTETIAGFNNLLTKQKQQPGRAAFWLALFNERVSFVSLAVPIAKATPLTGKLYVPTGATALYDAIGEMIQRLGRRATRLTPVLVVIITDGQDTCSRRFTADDIRQMVSYRRHSHDWQFLFLGPKSGLAYAQSIGIPADHIFNFSADALGVAQILDRLGASLEAYRAGDSDYILRLQSGTEKT